MDDSTKGNASSNDAESSYNMNLARRTVLFKIISSMKKISLLSYLLYELQLSKKDCNCDYSQGRVFCPEQSD